VLVNPRLHDVLTHPDTIALASGAQDLLERAVLTDTLVEALHGCELVGAVTARLREFSPPVIDPQQFAARLAPLRQAGGIGKAALVFGNERVGLSNQDVELCNVLVNIPANPEYSSLNLAQATQVLAYVCRMAMTDGVPTSSAIGFSGVPAQLDQIEAMFEHLEQSLIAIEFIDPAAPKKLMTRLRRLFARTQLEVEEVNILRGIAKKILDKKQP